MKTMAVTVSKELIHSIRRVKGRLKRAKAGKSINLNYRLLDLATAEVPNAFRLCWSTYEYQALLASVIATVDEDVANELCAKPEATFAKYCYRRNIHIKLKKKEREISPLCRLSLAELFEIPKTSKDIDRLVMVLDLMWSDANRR